MRTVFRRNVLANYASQIYVTLVGIVTLPLYLKYMGAEAYGLVGFFGMLQVSFNLLDMGLTPTVARETARLMGGATDPVSFRRLLRALQLALLGVALLGGGSMFASADVVATKWLKVGALPLTEVELCVRLMAVGVTLRWMSGLYRGCVSGAERLVWLGGYNVLVATLRFVAVLPALMYFGATPTVFFGYQFVVALVELSGLVSKAHSLFPLMPQGQRVGWSFAPVKSVLTFSLSVAFTSSVWVLVTQIDKLLLSKVLPLAEYGYFSLAVLVASGVMIISGPISGALLPRMARLHAEGDETGLIRVYRQATQAVTVIAAPASIALAYYAYPLMWAWTGDAGAAAKAAPVLTLYALGNGFLAMAAFPYYLQYAKGDLKLHLLGNAIFVLLFVPLLLWSTWQYGAVGAGYAWLGANALLFFAWVPVIHLRFARGLHFKWLIDDIGRILPFVIVTIATAKPFLDLHSSRSALAMAIGTTMTLSVAVAAAASPHIRTTVLDNFGLGTTKHS